MNILLVEDDLDLGNGVHLALKDQQFNVTWVRRIAEAQVMLTERPCDLLVLDLGLPDGDGLGLLARVRHERHDLPILILTARDGLDDRLRGLDGGADDYVIKPFALAELLSRIRALARRSLVGQEQVFEVRGLTLNAGSRRVSVHGREVELSPTEFVLLAFLIQRQDRVQARDTLEEKALAACSRYSSNALEVHMSGLRRQIGEGYVRTVRGVGYVIDRQAYEGVRR